MFGTGGKIGNSFEFVVEQCDFSKPVQTVSLNRSLLVPFGPGGANQAMGDDEC